MTVINETPSSVKIFLTKFEVKKYFTDLENIIFSRKDVKETVLLLLSIATNKNPLEKGSDLVLEVFPTSNGGCILSYEFLGERKQNNKSIKVKNKNFVYTFGFKSFEDIIFLAKALTYFETFSHENSVFFMGNEYYTVIDIPEFDKKTPVIINEFANFSARGKIIKALLLEHGICLFESNAINEIKSVFI